MDLPEDVIAADDEIIENEVSRAIDEGELSAYCQPIIEIGSGIVSAAEALARWMQDGTAIPAAAFIPSLERRGTATGLDWVIAEQICSFLESSLGTAAFVPVSINFSRSHIGDDGFARKLAATTEWHGIPADMVRVELPYALVASDAADGLIASVAEAGFVPAADNVEGGIEGLGILASKGVHVAKVSPAWWRGRAIGELSAYAKAAEESCMLLSAEGVENRGELDFLAEAGFPRAQGYFVGMPMPQERFSELAEARLSTLW